MSDSYFRHRDVEEIKRHIDRRFAEFELRLEQKAESERFKASMKRDNFHFIWMTLVIIVLSAYYNWDFWGSLFGAR